MRGTVRRLVVSLVVVGALVLGATVAVNLDFDRRVDGLPRVEVAGLATTPGNARNFLLIGSDSREFVGDDPAAQEAFGTAGDAGGQRADSIMIVHVDDDDGFVVSVPRDLWVDIPGAGGSRINTAFNDGPSKVVETITANLGVPIHHYLQVDFAGFSGLVDAVGGVSLYFPAPARDTVSGLHVDDAPACVHLDGDHALAFVRSRNFEELVDDTWVTDPTGDIGRMARQQIFLRRLASDTITTIVEQPLRAHSVADASVELLEADTTLTPDDVRALLRAFRAVEPDDPGSLEMITMPWTTGPSQGGQSVLYLDDAAAAAVLARLRDPGITRAEADTVHPASVRVRVLNGTDTPGLARSTADALVAEGFVPAGIGDADAKPVASTEVRYRAGAEPHARTVAAYLGGVGRLVEDPATIETDVTVILGADFFAIVPPAEPADSTPSEASTEPEVAPAPEGDPAAGC